MKCIILFFALFHYSIMGTRCASTIHNVFDYGAVGNGLSDDTIAFAKAWEEACSSSTNFAIMRIPADKIFLIQPSRFNGPCSPNNITVQIDGNVVGPADPSDWKKCQGQICREWIHFYGINGLRLVGQGTIDGRGQMWWDKYRGIKPTSLQIAAAENVLLSGLQFKDSPQIHVFLNQLNHAYVSNLTIHAPEQSPNTDGIHVAGCTNAAIVNVQIGTGDDCISIVHGSSHVIVGDIVCGPGHGISIGGLGKNGAEDQVEYIRVRDVAFIGGQNGARIKTWQGGRGYVRHILFERLLFHGTENPIIINQFYCDKQVCVDSESAVKVSNVTFREVLGTSSLLTPAVTLKCSEAVPCRDILIKNMHIRTIDDREPSSECINVVGRTEEDEVPKMACLV